MHAICAYCGISLGERGAADDESVTHGICEPCADWLVHRSHGLDLSEYLDGFEVPVAIFDREVRLVACNQKFSALVGKPVRPMVSALVGEALECRFARMPEGCGRTIHCQTCTIRRAIEHTVATGEPRRRVPASLEHESETVDLLISSERVGEVVRMLIEERSPDGPEPSEPG